MDNDFGIICAVLGYNVPHYAELEQMSFDDLVEMAKRIYNSWLESDPTKYAYASEFAFDYIHGTMQEVTE